ncbi:GNAT family N-acetyltransferase [Aquimarina agarilytica]|uniref:GNAT family N-acetyltransferase n=1 Tax=Aquimarina agarilytica TaxID=1087449 RepID=UPI00028834DC|nr:GNAT family N-acetyltransferase [Aquimarina agarilytica]
MIKLIRTNSSNSDFSKLVKHLDAYLAKIDGDEHDFYAQFNKINALQYVVVAYENDQPISCGAIKQVGNGSMEVKRMYTLPEYRGKGIATRVLLELEQWAKELSYDQCVLETGKRQPEAIRLYEKNGYQLIPNYGQYVGVENSLCFGKWL